VRWLLVSSRFSPFVSVNDKNAAGILNTSQTFLLKEHISFRECTYLNVYLFGFLKRFLQKFLQSWVRHNILNNTEDFYKDVVGIWNGTAWSEDGL
jgi:hypothetical protein